MSKRKSSYGLDKGRGRRRNSPRWTGETKRESSLVRTGRQLGGRQKAESSAGTKRPCEATI